jgi:serine/threonine protein kinase/tetratricopeptide (TPR) repeat protein
MEDALSTRVRFGEFELNVKTGELCPVGRQDGPKVLLQEQPFQLLRLLIEHGGEIATRQEIKGKLWPNDTVVDFDHGINGAIATLRRVLGDSAGEPRYIETVGRRGYRLIVSTTWLEAAAELLTARTPDRVAEAEGKSRPGLDSLIGKKVSHYRVLEVIGGGGMGMVYKAEDLKLSRPVALKFLPEELASDPVALQRFEREAQTASALNHPNICTIYEIEEFDCQPFIVMELLEGETLLQHLATSVSKTVPLARLVDIAIQICDGLQAAHNKGIIHRDIKPANIFLTKQGPVKILDFGLAKVAAGQELPEEAAMQMPEVNFPLGWDVSHGSYDGRVKAIHATLTRTGTAMGTAGYMSPEQIRKEKLDVRTDVFSFGLVLYEAAAGWRAFTGQTAPVVCNAILQETPVSVRNLNPAIPRRLEAVIAKALEKDRAQRYQSCPEMRVDIERVKKEMQPARRQLRTWLSAITLLVLLGLVMWTYWPSHHRVTLSRNDTVVIAASNQTGDPVLDDALYFASTIGVEQTPYLNVLGTGKMAAALDALHLPPDPAVTPQIARKICVQSNSRMVIAASLTEAGNNFRIETAGIDCPSGMTITAVRKETPSRTEIIHMLGLSVAELRRNLGEPASSVASFATPVEEATSRSPEALHLMMDGYRHHLVADLRGAIQYYQRAIQIDPNFAIAYSALAHANDTLGEDVLAARAATKGYELRLRLTQPRRLHAETDYYELVTGEQEKDRAVLSEWVRTFPDDFFAHMNLAWCLSLLGLRDEALAESREAARLYPSPVSYGRLVLDSILADRLDEAQATFADADARKFDSVDLRYDRLLLAFLKKDTAAMKVQWNWAADKPQAGYRLLHGKALVESYYGHYRSARLLDERALHMSDKAGTSPTGAVYDSGDALNEAEAGNLARARGMAEKALKTVEGRNVRLAAALTFARAGNIEQARTLADSADQAAPSDTVIQHYSLPTIRAAIKLAANDPVGAVEILRVTERYEMSHTVAFNSLYPAYIRGLAYLQMHEDLQAIQEFQKLLDHPGIVGRNVIGALSHLQMARAEKLAGNGPAARKSYDEFLTLWKDADSDLPVYQQAKAEYAKMHSH